MLLAYIGRILQAPEMTNRLLAQRKFPTLFQKLHYLDPVARKTLFRIVGSPLAGRIFPECSLTWLGRSLLQSKESKKFSSYSINKCLFDDPSATSRGMGVGGPCGGIASAHPAHLTNENDPT